jgi:predicted Fe-Mo cluster-binding NifX family protein
MPTKHSPKETTVRIAIPVADGQLHGHFGGCAEYALIDAETERRMIFDTQFVAAPPHQPGRLPLWLREQGVQAVIVGGIGRRALDIFAQHGIQVHAGRVGDSIEQLAVDYLDGLLGSAPPPCEHHGHHHDHAHGETHSCSDQGGH